MKIYLIDYENEKDLTKLTELTAEDIVVLFYSKNANTITLDCLRGILEIAKLELKNVEVGEKNALDFQLSSYLGYLIKEYEEQNPEIIIVSNDKGYGCVASFWAREKSLDISLLSNGQVAKKTAGNTKSKVASAKKPATERTKIKSALTRKKIELSEEETEKIIEIATTYQDLIAANAELNRLLRDSTRAGEVFGVIKAYIQKNKNATSKEQP